MNRTSLTIAGGLTLLLGVVVYLLGVSGALWTKTPPGDVGLVGFSALLVLLGGAALWARPKAEPMPA